MQPTTTSSVFVLSVFYFLTTNCLNINEELLNDIEQQISELIPKYQAYRPTYDNSEFITNSRDVQELEPVDFVVVGTGTAGAIVANRLSENPDFQVMSIEAGGYENNLTAIPGLSGSTFNSPFNWAYKSEPMTHSFGLKNNHTLTINRGKGFGGTTIFNGLRHVRGSWIDWDNLGYENWDSKTMLKYFKKFENSELEYEDFGYHGKKGPANIANPKDKFPQTLAIIKGFQEFGMKYVDYNGAKQLGVAQPQMMTKNGWRISTGTAYINPIIERKNLQLVDRAFVVKLVINPKTKIAEGVIFSRNGKLYKIPARKEVILSAGAINTPQLLMLSGVGPSRDLKRLKINTIADLPVGLNLKDHPFIHAAYINFDEKFALPEKTMKEHLIDLFNGGGLYSVGVGTRAFTFHKTKYAQSGADLLCSYNGPINLSKPSAASSPYTEDVFNAQIKDVNINAAVAVSCMNTKPKSLGSIKLRSSNPYEHPIINLNHLENIQDVQVLAESGKIVKSMLKMKALKKLNASMSPFIVPACKDLEYFSEEYWMCHVKYLTSGAVHTYNTCAMGEVVNNELKVNGIKALRVVDASVIKETSGYPLAVVMAIAERASDLIKDEHENCKK